MNVLIIGFALLLGGAVGAAAVAAILRVRSAQLQEQMSAAAARAREHITEALRAASSEARERMRDEMEALSVHVLERTGNSLAQRLQAQRRVEEERIAGELEARTEQIKGLVAPISEKLGKVESEIGRLERERRQAEGELSNMVRQLQEGVGTLRAETGNLVSALKRPSTRGSWGEIQLRNVIEMAGMVEHCDFSEQSTIQSEEGGVLRPDVLVRLPGGRVVVVDSKVPLDAYLAHLEAAEEDESRLHLARHAKQTREHITKLASKGYQRQFDSIPELVVMFIPSDGIYQAALSADHSLIEYGVRQQVVIATPTTLIGLLLAIHHGWRQERIAQSAKEIGDAARELHRRLGRFLDPFAKVGRQLGSAVSAYNDAVGSFDRRVIPQIRRIEQAGAGSERLLDAPEPLESMTRELAAEISDADRAEAEIRGPEGAEADIGASTGAEADIGASTGAEADIGGSTQGATHTSHGVRGEPEADRELLTVAREQILGGGPPHFARD